MTSNHLFSTSKLKPQKIYHGGTRADIMADVFPILKGMSLSILRLDPSGFREPHWHPNAHELSYCLEGKALLTIFSPGGGHDTMLLEAGDLAFVPMGFIHHIENLGQQPASFLICFSNERAEDLNFSASFGVMPNHVLGATFKVDGSFFDRFNKSAESVFIAEQKTPSAVLPSYEVNRFKMALEKIQPQLISPGGHVRMSNGYLLPELLGLALYSLKLEVKGVREPHWHPNASELNYLISGNARITVLSPGAKVDTFDMVPGDIGYIPRGYFHHIENTGTTPARFAVFFNNAYPSDLGIAASLAAYSPEIMATLFGVSTADIDTLPKYQQDLLIVAGGG
jgi:oxalate decarboxylase